MPNSSGILTEKEYLGDSVFANYDNYHIVLTTENGFGPSNTIYLDSMVMANLLKYISARPSLDEKPTDLLSEPPKAEPETSGSVKPEDFVAGM